MTPQPDNTNLSGIPSIEGADNDVTVGADFDLDDFADFADVPPTIPLANIPQIDASDDGQAASEEQASSQSAFSQTIPEIIVQPATQAATEINTQATATTPAQATAITAAQAVSEPASSADTEVSANITASADAQASADITTPTIPVDAAPSATPTDATTSVDTTPIDTTPVVPVIPATAGIKLPDAYTMPELSVISPDAAQAVIPASAGDLARTSEKYQSRNRKRGKRIRAVVSVFIILLLAYGIFQVVKGMFKEDINERLAGSDTVAASNAKEALTPMVSTDPFYMMLIGSDSRNDDENERSDTNIVARVDPQTGTVNIISIPRDTAISLEGYGTQKFNAAYAYYGTEGAIKAAEGLLGVNISHYAEIDFAGMVELVNAIGGVDVDVPMRIEDANAGDQVIEAGMQHLDGEKALIFARSRSYTNGDFQRTANQRLLIEALLAKVSTMNRVQLAPVMDAAANYMTSDMTVDQMEDYALLMQNFETINMYSVMVPSKTATSEGVSYVVCDTDLLREVMEKVSKGEDPSSLVNDASVLSSAEAEEEGAESTPIYEPEID